VPGTARTHPSHCHQPQEGCLWLLPDQQGLKKAPPPTCSPPSTPGQMPGVQASLFQSPKAQDLCPTQRVRCVSANLLDQCQSCSLVRHGVRMHLLQKYPTYNLVRALLTLHQWDCPQVSVPLCVYAYVHTETCGHTHFALPGFLAPDILLDMATLWCRALQSEPWKEIKSPSS
jgi:hypothetical protein